jgi:hypothetical protein
MMLARRALAVLPGALALAMPAAPSTAQSLTVALCGDPSRNVTIPMGGGQMPADHGCCKAACHAACERKHSRDGNRCDDDEDDDA